MSFPRLNKYWVLVAAWMIFIFVGSTNVGAPRNTSRFLGPLLRWIYPKVSDDTVQAIQFFIRKSAHAVEYAILALLLWLALRKSRNEQSGVWKWQDARICVLFSALYAGTDELHQSFVPTRQGSPWDVLLDTTGAALTILFLWRMGRWRGWWK